MGSPRRAHVMINFSDLLWKSNRGATHRFAGPFFPNVEENDRPFVLEHVSIDEANPQPGSCAALLMDPRGVGADRFRYLRMRLRELRHAAKLQSIVITSPDPEDGKSTIAMCLATFLAVGGKHPVLLVEADLHHPTLASVLGLEPRPGLAECLENKLDPLQAIRKIEPLGWYFLHAGDVKSNPAELLQPDSLAKLMQRLTPAFDWIVIDSPPVLPLTDALALSREVDATLLVARADRTPREALDEAIKLIGRKRLIGVVLNSAGHLTRRYSKYDHYYKAQS